MQPSEAVYALIAEQVAKLEHVFGSITSCHVGLRAPSDHHRSGGAFELSIRLALPGGREVEVRRTPKLDERHADLHFAVNDAFRRARRQLQGHVRRMQDHVKAHAHLPAGTVARFDQVAGYGFIQAEDGHEVYFHKNSLINRPSRKIAAGTRVTFVEEIGEKGPQASTVRILGKHGMRQPPPRSPR
jgi:cold shock CspA family protein/ribosome-associated translation inhibitor RaiA